MHLHIYPLLFLFVLHVITSSPLPLAPHRIRYPLTSTPSILFQQPQQLELELESELEPPLHEQAQAHTTKHAEQEKPQQTPAFATKHEHGHAEHTMQTVSDSDVTTFPQYNSITGQ